MATISQINGICKYNINMLLWWSHTNIHSPTSMSHGHPHSSRYARLVAAFSASAFALLLIVSTQYSDAATTVEATIQAPVYSHNTIHALAVIEQYKKNKASKVRTHAAAKNKVVPAARPDPRKYAH